MDLKSYNLLINYVINTLLNCFLYEVISLISQYLSLYRPKHWIFQIFGHFFITTMPLHRHKRHNYHRQHFKIVLSTDANNTGFTILYLWLSWRHKIISLFYFLVSEQFLEHLFNRTSQYFICLLVHYDLFCISVFIFFKGNKSTERLSSGRNKSI